MPSLKKLLTDQDTTAKKTHMGIVSQRLGENLYTVSADGVNVTAKALTHTTLKAGERVVLTKTGDAWFIVGGESLKNRNLQVVVVDG